MGYKRMFHSTVRHDNGVDIDCRAVRITINDAKACPLLTHRFCILIFAPIPSIINEKLIITAILAARSHCRRIASHHCPRLYHGRFRQRIRLQVNWCLRHMGALPFSYRNTGNHAIVSSGRSDGCPGHRARNINIAFDPFILTPRDEICP